MVKRKPTAWNLYVKKISKKNPKMKFKDVLRTAAKTYSK